MIFEINGVKQEMNSAKFDHMHDNFLWILTARIKKMLAATTQSMLVLLDTFLSESTSKPDDLQQISIGKMTMLLWTLSLETLALNDGPAGHAGCKTAQIYARKKLS